MEQGECHRWEGKSIDFCGDSSHPLLSMRRTAWTFSQRYVEPLENSNKCPAGVLTHRLPRSSQPADL